MPSLKSISQHLKYLLLGLSLLSVLSLNKREVAIQLEKPASEQAVKASNDQCVLKEKVSFEAVPSIIVLPDAIFPEPIVFHFSPVTVAAPLFSLSRSVFQPVLQRLLASSNSPNAP